MTLYLLKVHLQTFLSIPITQKYQILSCETLVANERYGVKEITYKILVGEVKLKKKKKDLLKSRYRCEDNASIRKMFKNKVLGC
jgi:hypothetical protein